VGSLRKSNCHSEGPIKEGKDMQREEAREETDCGDASDNLGGGTQRAEREENILNDDANHDSRTDPDGQPER